jgi:hypothetical protein
MLKYHRIRRPPDELLAGDPISNAAVLKLESNQIRRRLDELLAGDLSSTTDLVVPKTGAPPRCRPVWIRIFLWMDPHYAFFVAHPFWWNLSRPAPAAVPTLVLHLFHLSWHRRTHIGARVHGHHNRELDDTTAMLAGRSARTCFSGAIRPN